MCISCLVMSDSAVPRTIALLAPLSMEFSRPEYWSGYSFPSPRDLPDPGIKPRSPGLQADSLLPEPPGKPVYHQHAYQITQLLLASLIIRLVKNPPAMQETPVQSLVWGDPLEKG